MEVQWISATEHGFYGLFWFCFGCPFWMIKAKIQDAQLGRTDLPLWRRGKPGEAMMVLGTFRWKIWHEIWGFRFCFWWTWAFFLKKEKCYQWYSPFSKQGLAVSRSLGILKIALGDDPLLLGDQPLLDLEWLVHVSWFGVVELHHWNRLIDLSTVAWNPYVNGNFRILKWRYCTI